MRTVLIIEDNLEIRENTAEILELAGFKVAGAINGREGIQMASSMTPDLILCDIMMPEVSGYEVLSELKKNPNTKQIPFIYVTASTEKKEIQRALQMGADGYVSKPFDVNELMTTIDHALKKL